MLKKSVLLVIVLIVALSCAFAGSSDKGVIDITLTPSSKQMIKVDKDTYKSTSGFGASVGYMKSVAKGLSVGAALEWGNFKQEKLLSYGAFNTVAILARCDYKFNLSEKVFADAGLGLGYELCIVGKNTFNSFVAELTGEFGITVDSVFSVLAGAKGKAAIQKTTQVFSVLPFVGAGITL